jgi:citrate synthase
MSGKTIANLICNAKGARHRSFIFSGLEGIVAAITSISNINPTQGDVVYRGYDIRALLKRSTYEEVAFLLLYGRLSGLLPNFLR